MTTVQERVERRPTRPFFCCCGFRNLTSNKTCVPQSAYPRSSWSSAPVLPPLVPRRLKSPQLMLQERRRLRLLRPPRWHPIQRLTGIRLGPIAPVFLLPRIAGAPRFPPHIVAQWIARRQTQTPVGAPTLSSFPEWRGCMPAPTPIGPTRMSPWPPSWGGHWAGRANAPAPPGTIAPVPPVDFIPAPGWGLPHHADRDVNSDPGPGGAA